MATQAPNRRTLSDVLTPALVARVALTEAERPSEYRAALALVGQYARRYPYDVDDVAAIASVILGTTMTEWPEDTCKAASLAVYRAASEVSALNVAQGQACTVLAGDTLTTDDAVGQPMGRAEYPAPDGITRWTVADRLAALADMSTDVDAGKILSAMRRQGTTSAVARALDMPTGGRNASAVAARAASVVAECAANVGTLAAWEHASAPVGRVNDGARDWARDTRVPTSGPASLVVRTRPDGSRWVTLSDRSIRVTEEAARAVLAGAPVVPAYTEGTASEVASADLLGAWQAGTARPARRPQGVGVGMRYGANRVAGDTSPDPRPTVSRKRKRDGGIGGPMLPA